MPASNRPTVSPHPEPPLLPFASAAAWEKWLAREHARSDAVSVKFAKKGSGIPSVTYEQAVEVALCYGWIDGLKRSIDEQYYSLRFTPRRPRSRWSQNNCTIATRLIESGRMKPAGLAQVEAARADGRWDAAYAGPGTMQVPADLAAALKAAPAAAAFFKTLDSRNRYAILYRIHDAKRPETRARRIETFVAMLAEGETIY